MYILSFDFMIDLGLDVFVFFAWKVTLEELRFVHFRIRTFLFSRALCGMSTLCVEPDLLDTLSDEH